MLKLNYFLADIFILSAEKQPIKLSWRKIEWLLINCKHSCMGDGNPLAKRMFHVHREAIAELFGVEIKCDLSTCEYYVSSPELNSFTVSNMVDAGRNMKGRILLKEIPAGDA